MSERELIEYLRESDSSLQPTDVIKVVVFEHGTKAQYYHKDTVKPYKTRVFLKNEEPSPMK